jgi:Uncharacterized alpha/beta hydrolase domain (DUF2235)
VTSNASNVFCLTLAKSAKSLKSLVGARGPRHTPLDCYTAIIRFWRPGDWIFLFGFSRRAYTVRCLATALCYSGVPTQTAPGVPLRRDEASAHWIARSLLDELHICDRPGLTVGLFVVGPFEATPPGRFKSCPPTAAQGLN